MSEPIILSKYECDELVNFFIMRAPIYRENAGGFILELVNQLNKLREPDPIGTVRVSSQGSVAVKVNHVSEQWFVVSHDTNLCTKHIPTERVIGWTVIHRP